MRIEKSFAKNQLVFVKQGRWFSIVDLRMNGKGELMGIEPYADYELAEIKNKDRENEAVKILGGFNQLSEIYDLMEKA